SSAHFTGPSIFLKRKANARPCGDTTVYLSNPLEG
ncbi:dimethyl sulfoxide reductase subunit B, partial [Klebsiella pneumoniae]